VTVNGPTTMQAGQVTSMTIQARDAFGNPKPSPVDGFLVLLNLNGATSGGVPSFMGNGTYVFRQNVTEQGNYVIHATYNQQDVFGSPFLLQVVPGKGPLTASAKCFCRCFCSCHQGYCSLKRMIHAELYRVENELDSNLASCFQRHPDGPLESKLQLAESYSWLGAYCLKIRVFSSFSLLLWPGPVLAATSTLSGSGLQSTTAGSLQTVDVQPTDVFGNPTSGVVDEHGVAVVFQLDITGPAHLAAPFTLLPGRHEANYTLTRVGTYTVAVTSSATNVVGSPYQITIFPGDPPHGLCSSSRLKEFQNLLSFFLMYPHLCFCWMWSLVSLIPSGRELWHFGLCCHCYDLAKPARSLNTNRIPTRHNVLKWSSHNHCMQPGGLL
jgi:hypothetical protein